MRRERHAPTAEAADDDEQSFQDEVFVLAPRRRGRGRGRGRGRPRVAEAQGVEPEPADEPVVFEYNLNAWMCVILQDGWITLLLKQCCLNLSC